jgi:hypothetical protein
VVSAAVLVVWSETLMTALKGIGKEDLPVAHSVNALDALFTTIPVRADVTILLESDDVAAALIECERTEQQHFDPIKYTNSRQWSEFLPA